MAPAGHGGADGHIACGAASIDITPQAPCALGGFSGPPRLWNRIESALEANAIALDDGRDLVCLVSIDTLYIGAELTAWLDRAVAARWPDRETHVLTFASHTHFAPMLDRSKPALGPVDDTYVALLKEKLEGLLDALAAAPTSGASIRSAGGEIGVSVNRRLVASRPTWNNRFRGDPQVFLAPNPAGYVDRRLRVRLIEDAAGATQAAIAHFACHPTSYPDRHAVTSDYVGAIREAVRAETGAAVPVVFLQGCAGDVRASVQGSVSPISVLRTMKSGPHFRAATPQRWQVWRNEVAEAARGVLTCRDAAAEPLVGHIRADRARVPFGDLFEGAVPDAAMEMRHADIAGLRLLATTAEPLSAWSRRVPEDVLLAGYSGDCFGYLPSQADVAAGGYEVHGYHAFMDLPALTWRRDFEARVTEKMGALLAAADRPVAASA